MKSTRATFCAAMTLLAALAVPVRLAAQVADSGTTNFVIAYHEIAHAHTQHIAYAASRPVEKPALELIADLLATQWFYQKMVVNTPDTEQYRDFRKLSTHSQAISPIL